MEVVPRRPDSSPAQYNGADNSTADTIANASTMISTPVRTTIYGPRRGNPMDLAPEMSTSPAVGGNEIFCHVDGCLCSS